MKNGKREFNRENILFNFIMFYWYLLFWIIYIFL